MHSVTSNAVAQGLGKLQYLFPLRIERQIVTVTDWTEFLWIGNGFLDKYQSYPNINGKTKKCNLLMTLYTIKTNYISVGIKRHDDNFVTTLVEKSIFGGVGNGAFGLFVSVRLDPTFLQPQSRMYIKSSTGGEEVALANVFVEVIYE